MYEVRFYRDWVKKSGLESFKVAMRESDLMVSAERDLRGETLALLRDARAEIEQEIRQRPEFAESLAPLPMPASPTPLVRAMLEAAQHYDVGPMAAVAGAVAQFVGKGLLHLTSEIIVENGGDIFLKTDRPATLGLYAGKESPFSGEIKLRLYAEGSPLGVCTSSGTVGHSLSFGRADAVTAVADDAATADAAATAVANRIHSLDDVQGVLNEEKDRGLLKGLLIVIGTRIGAFGAIELAR